MEPAVGSILEGRITTITKFGAFVALEGGKSGLVHISEIANCFVNDVHDFLTEGDTVKVLVLSAEGGKINLSVKKAQPREERPQRRFAPGGNHDSGSRPPYPRNGQPRNGRNHTTSAHRPAENRGRFSGRASAPPADQTFEDKLKQFMSTSESKISDLNRNMDGKRGRGRRRKS